MKNLLFMEEESILDYEEEFSLFFYCDKSVRYLIYAFGFLLSYVGADVLISFFDLFSDVASFIVGILLLGVLIYSILGCWAGIQSVWHQEENSVKKYFGLLGNSFILVIFLMTT